MSSADAAGSRPFASASQWQRENGQAAVEWFRLLGGAQRMLDDVCRAVEMTVDLFVGNNADHAREVLAEYPQVLGRCDRLAFDEEAQAVAYLILHLPDRYCRLFHVLEGLLTSGRLPVGKNSHFAAIDIGAGPGPGIFAIRSFYALLARYAALHAPSWPIAAVGYSHVVERGRAMHHVMHQFAEALLVAEGTSSYSSADPSEPNPCAEQLKQSAIPFGARFDDFTGLDILDEHHAARKQLADELYREDELELSYEGARRLAYEAEIDQPSAYALAVMLNFLTPGSDALTLFSEAIDRLMSRTLVPGGTVLVLGATSSDYQQIYQDLDSQAAAAHLRVVEGFEEPLQAGHRPEELDAVCALTRRLWNKLEALAGDVAPIKKELRRRHAGDIFDESIQFRLLSFQVRAYRKGA
jgi:ribosomal protein RSM22 (predicted rRNA methylase)